MTTIFFIDPAVFKVTFSAINLDRLLDKYESDIEVGNGHKFDDK